MASTAGLDRHLACGAQATRLSPLSPRILQGGGVKLSAPTETFTFLCAPSVNFRGAGVARGQADQKGQAPGVSRIFKVAKNHDRPPAVAPFPPVLSPIPQVRRTCRGRAALGARLGTRARKPGVGGVG